MIQRAIDRDMERGHHGEGGRGGVHTCCRYQMEANRCNLLAFSKRQRLLFPSVSDHFLLRYVAQPMFSTMATRSGAWNICLWLLGSR